MQDFNPLYSTFSHPGYTTFKDIATAEREFERSWNNPKHTPIKLDDVDVNLILAKYYEASTPVKFTRKMLWDLETKKAWDPKSYIPYVLREGKSWGKKTLENGDELFVRSSQQRQWVNPEVYGEVFEEVYLNHRTQKATFLGTQRLKDSAGQWTRIENQQPLFHVQHSVAGTEEQPINIWRMVHLTETKDQNLIEFFEKFNNPSLLPGYIEKYIEKDLGVSLSHK